MLLLFSMNLKCKTNSREIPIVMFSVKYSTVQWSAVQFSLVQFSAVQFSAVQWSAVQLCAAHCSVLHCADAGNNSSVQCSGPDILTV